MTTAGAAPGLSSPGSKPRPITGRTPSIETGDGHTLSWNGHTWCGLVRLAKAPGADPCIPNGTPTLAEALRAAGYWTIGVASNQFLYEPSGFSRGFDDWVEVDDRRPVAGVKGTADWSLG